MDEAAVNLVAAGVVVVAGAGNDAADACQYTPAGAPGVLTVAASDEQDRLATFSNAGTCISVIGPG